MKKEYKSDLDNILATQKINGGDFWSTPDGGIAKGVPFSTLAIFPLWRPFFHKRPYSLIRIGGFYKLAEVKPFHPSDEPLIGLR
jgi:hypothetical protein